jgi:hypothetical protein
MICYDAAAVFDPVEEAFAEDLFDCVDIASCRELVHIGLCGANPLAIGVVEDYGAEGFKVFGEVHCDVITDDGLEGACLLAEEFHCVFGLGDAVALVGALVHEWRVPDEDSAGLFRGDSGFLRNCRFDLFGLLLAQLSMGKGWHCKNSS